MNHAPVIAGEILVVDDAPDALRLLARLLSDAGYSVRTAPSGELALWTATQLPPDLILLDVRMPGMNGFDVCRCLKQQPATATVPVIFISAASDPDDRIAGFEAGGVDFINKPLVESEMLARVKTHITMALAAREMLRRRKDAARRLPVSCEAAASGVPAKKEILVVEDTAMSLRLLVTILSDAGYSVREAPNGELALWTATKRPPDLVLLDIRMPGMNGFDVCRCLKLDPATASVPVIFLSALSAPEDKSEGFAVGAVDFITKPFSDKEVLARVKTHLRLAEANRPADFSMAAVVEGTSGGGAPVSTRELEAAFAASASAVMLTDIEERIVAVNEAFVRLTGYRLSELGDATPQVLLAEGERGAFSALWPELRAQGHWSGALGLRGKGGERLPCQLSISLMTDRAGTPLRCVAVLQDISRKPAEENRIDFRSQDDPPTMPPNRTPARERFDMEIGLRSVLMKDELELLYQPIVDLATARLAGAEALLRWNCAGFGTLLPERFLPLAEETGEAVAIGEWVADSVCAQVSRWQDELPAGFRIAFNLSSLQFWQDGLTAGIQRALSRSGLPAARLEIDIAEDTLQEDLVQGITVLRRLKKCGIALALGCHGPAGINRAAVSRLPIDCLKIAPSLISAMESEAATWARVGEIIELAHQTGLRALALGVETPQQLARLKVCRCDLAQGFLLAAPLSAEAFRSNYVTHHGNLLVPES